MNNKLINIKGYKIVVFIILAVFCFFIGCTNGNDNNESVDETNQNDIITDGNATQNETNKEETNKKEIIKLNSFNYKDYFVLQEKILSFEQTEYTQNYTKYVKISQMTKISILPLKANMIFDNVEFKVLYNYNISSSARYYSLLKLGYDGSGFTTVTDTFTKKVIEWSGTPITHIITDVIGSITIIS